MKSLHILLLLILFSCSEKQKPSNAASTPQSSGTIIKEKKVEKPDSALIAWFEFYYKENPGFDADKFVQTSSSAITYSPSPVAILNSKGFNEIYKPFFVFNKSGTKYIDFDSYQWFVAKDGSASFEADQQVALVDLKEKTALQIAFFGPSYRIEEAFWKGDSTAVLLGNSYEKVPFMMKFNFQKNTVQHFQYSDTLKFERPYSQMRLQKFGIRTQ